MNLKSNMLCPRSAKMSRVREECESEGDCYKARQDVSKREKEKAGGANLGRRWREIKERDRVTKKKIKERWSFDLKKTFGAHLN